MWIYVPCHYLIKCYSLILAANIFSVVSLTNICNDLQLQRINRNWFFNC